MAKKNDMGGKEWFRETDRKGCTYKENYNYNIIKAIKRFFKIK